MKDYAKIEYFGHRLLIDKELVIYL